MNVRQIAWLMFLICGLGLRCSSPALEPEGFVRGLPDAYVAGKAMTVHLDLSVVDFSSFYGVVMEIVPPGWSLDWSNIAPLGFNEDTRTIYWEFELWSTWGINIRYDVTAPAGSTGDVSFEGECFYSLTPTGEGRAYRVTTTGDITLTGRLSATRRVPEGYPTIQDAIDASLFGDTVLVSNAGRPYRENIRMKQGVDLSGSGRPVLQTLVGSTLDSPPLIWASPNTTIRGIHISSAGTGILIGSHDVRVSNCLITATEECGVEYNTAVMGRITNCTFIGNGTAVGGAGLTPDDILVTNCIFRDNDQDVRDAHVTFSCLEDEILGGTGEDNIYAYPMFVNAAAGDYRLLPGSPCIDAGDNSVVGADEHDLAGNPRIMSGGRGMRVDMGAYEHRAPPPVFDPLAGEFGIKWSSTPGKAYSAFFSDDLLTWRLADADVVATRSVTIWLDPIGWPPLIPTRFYRIMENE